jgi:hypothetical protein
MAMLLGKSLLGSVDRSYPTRYSDYQTRIDEFPWSGIKDVPVSATIVEKEFVDELFTRSSSLQVDLFHGGGKPCLVRDGKHQKDNTTS